MEDEGQSAYMSDGEVEGGAKQNRRRAPAHLANPARSSIDSSGYSGYTAPGDIDRLETQHRAGIFPSPTMRGHAHRKPETDEEITTYLLKAASRNDRRIIPAGRDKPITPSATPFPPSSGTRLKGLTEELGNEDSDEDYDIGLTPRTPQSKRVISKVILGRGAYEAGLAIENERRILKDALEKSVLSHNSS